MSTPANNDLILVERSGTVYKETKANWDTATGGGGGSGGGGTATNNLAIQFAHSSMGGYSNAGSHFYASTGKLYYHRLDSSGAYTLSSTTTNNSSTRPNTKLKIDNTWYEVVAGTAYTQTTGAGPFNVYYYRSMTSWTLTASEIQTACGASSGTISGIAVKMDDAPSRTMPNHYIGVKLVSTGNADTNNSGTNNGSYTQVSFANPRNWVGATEESYVEITFSTNISWS